MPIEFLELWSEPAKATIEFVHSAGVPTDNPSATTIAQALAEQELRAVRFKFS